MVALVRVFGQKGVCLALHLSCGSKSSEVCQMVYNTKYRVLSGEQ